MRYRLQQILGVEAIRRTWLPLPVRRGMTKLARVQSRFRNWCICHEREAVFATNYKAASRSWLLSMAGPKALQLLDAKEHYRDIIRQLMSEAHDFQPGKFEAEVQSSIPGRHHAVLSKVNHYFHFGVVRDPFSRFAGLYLSKYLDTAGYGKQILKDLDGWDSSHYAPTVPLFMELLKLPDLPHPQRMEALLHRLRGTDVDNIDDHTGLQTTALRRVDGSPLDYVVRFEDLEGGAAEVEKRCGLKLLTHVNKGGGDIDWRDLYTPASVRMVAEIYRRDIEQFGYEQAHEELLAWARREPKRQAGG